MMVLLVYDSQFGNTEKIARAVVDGFILPHKVRLVRADEVTLRDLEHIDIFMHTQFTSDLV